jgi:heme oxygenase
MSTYIESHQEGELVSSLALSELLKTVTSSTHESLDQRIMRAAPFSGRQRYRQFLRMQYRFHWLLSPLFTDKALNHLLDLEGSCRLQQVASDCLDLKMTSEQLAKEVSNITPLQGNNSHLDISTFEALGWLYTIEGSNIGAAFLFKFAKKLGFDENFAASHLSGHPEGRGKHWRKVKSKLDTLSLSPSEREQACIGAQRAFDFVRAQVEELLADQS